MVFIFAQCWALHAESLYEQDILLEVARTMARLHSMRDVPVARNRSFLNDKFQTFRSLIATRNDMTFDEYSDWLSNQNRKQFGIDFNLENEMVEVETSLRNSPQELVFCHNDLFVYNILYRETATQASKMILTNFDLCGYNYPAYDFAHLFNSVYLEHAGYPLEEILPFNAEPFNQLRHRLLTLYYEEMRKINPSTASSNAATNSGRHLNESVINNQEVIRFQSYSTLLGILLILATQFHANETLPVCDFTVSLSFFFLIAN